MMSPAQDGGSRICDILAKRGPTQYGVPNKVRGECMYTWGLVVKQFDPGFPQPTCRIVLGLCLQFVSVDDCVINSWHLCEWGEV